MDKPWKVRLKAWKAHLKEWKVHLKAWTAIPPGTPNAWRIGCDAPKPRSLQHLSKKTGLHYQHVKHLCTHIQQAGHLAVLKSDATIRLARRGMSGLGAVICSREDEGGVTVSDLTLSNPWATKTMVFWTFRARRKTRSFGKKTV